MDEAWKCDVCGAIFSERDMAEDCEADHAFSETLKIKHAVFDPGSRIPTYLVVSSDDPDVPDMTYVYAHQGASSS